MNPNEFYLLRTFNAGLAILALVIMLGWGWRRWKSLPGGRRVRLMSLNGLIFTGAYGSFEAAYLETLYRVPMFTVAVTWAIIARFIKEEDE